MSDFNEKSLEHIETPLFVVFGENDEVLPVETNADYLLSHAAAVEKHIFEGEVGHFVFLRSATEEGNEVLPQALIQDPLGVDRERIHHDTQELALDFFDQKLSDKRVVKP